MIILIELDGVAAICGNLVWVSNHNISVPCGLLNVLFCCFFNSVFRMCLAGEWLPLRWTVVLLRQRKKRSPWMWQQHTQRTTRPSLMLVCPKKWLKVLTTSSRQVGNGLKDVVNRKSVRNVSTGGKPDVCLVFFRLGGLCWSRREGHRCTTGI